MPVLYLTLFVSMKDRSLECHGLTPRKSKDDPSVGFQPSCNPKRGELGPAVPVGGELVAPLSGAVLP